MIGVSSCSEVRNTRKNRTFRSIGQVLGSVAFALGVIAVLLAQVLHASSERAKIGGWLVS